MFQRLPIALAQLKVSNTLMGKFSWDKLSRISQIFGKFEKINPKKLGICAFVKINPLKVFHFGHSRK